jgi:hypothetical protein
MPTVNVRYIVHDVDAATSFDCDLSPHGNDTGDEVAKLSRVIWWRTLSSPRGPGGGAQAMLDGTVPAPGGRTVSPSKSRISPRLSRRHGPAGHDSATTLVTGVGGKPILVEDPSGNQVELFEPLLEEAQLSFVGVTDGRWKTPTTARPRRDRRLGGDRLPFV